jgi:hypothetical protein
MGIPANNIIKPIVTVSKPHPIIIQIEKINAKKEIIRRKLFFLDKRARHPVENK